MGAVAKCPDDPVLEWQVAGRVRAVDVEVFENISKIFENDFYAFQLFNEFVADSNIEYPYNTTKIHKYVRQVNEEFYLIVDYLINFAMPNNELLEKCADEKFYDYINSLRFLKNNFNNVQFKLKLNSK